jgi:hypothetical protein
MTGIFTETSIGNHNQVWYGLFDGSGGFLDNAAIMPRAGCFRIFAFGNAK